MEALQEMQIATSLFDKYMENNLTTLMSMIKKEPKEYILHDLMKLQYFLVFVKIITS